MAVGCQETPLKIALLGKSGDGKSSTGNTILGENAFRTSNSPDSETFRCQSRTDKNNRITVIDTPGLFDTVRKEEDVKKEIMRCIIESSPGPHAFVIVLKVGRYTEQEEQVVEKLMGLFGEEALEFTMIVFTRGDELDENERIDQFVRKNEQLRRFVDKCGGRCHVIDNKYWRNSQNGYRNNRVQIEKIINTVQTMVKNNNGSCYTNEMLKAVQARLQEEEKRLRQERGWWRNLVEGMFSVSDDEIRAQAKENVLSKFILEFAKMYFEKLLEGWLKSK